MPCLPTVRTDPNGAVYDKKGLRVIDKELAEDAIRDRLMMEPLCFGEVFSVQIWCGGEQTRPCLLGINDRSVSLYTWEREPRLLEKFSYVAETALSGRCWHGHLGKPPDNVVEGGHNLADADGLPEEAFDGGIGGTFKLANELYETFVNEDQLIKLEWSQLKDAGISDARLRKDHYVIEEHNLGGHAVYLCPLLINAFFSPCLHIAVRSDPKAS